MPDLPPYVQAVEHLPVRAFVRGFQHDAVVLGWCATQVYLRWKSEMGNHLGWLPAADVERPSVHPVDDRR